MTDAASAGVLLAGLGALHCVYTYVAYPWIVSLLPARPPRPRVGPAPRLVSIIIAARDPGATVAAKVGELLGTVSLDCEVVVVLDGPDPAALAARAEVADDRIKGRALGGPPGKAAAPNPAVAMAPRDVVLVTPQRQPLAPGA